MEMDSSFRFLDDQRNHRLMNSVRKADIKHCIDADGVLHFSSRDDELVENELIKSLRDERFPSWQILSCPSDWTERYREYMMRHAIPFEEELIDGQTSFLISRKHRPLQWRLAPVAAGNGRSETHHALRRQTA